MKGFLLCAGLGSRLRPLTHFLPKTCVPFLNLPLLYYNWFYLEKLGMKEVSINSHLFPNILQTRVKEIQQPFQKVHFSFEEKSLGSGRGLFSVKENLQDTFFYLNGDSLFFPSQESLFETFLNQEFSLGLFWTIPIPSLQPLQKVFWIDEEGLLKVIGGEDDVKKASLKISFSKDLKRGELRPVQFVGLALFKKEFLKLTSKQTQHIFYDIMIPRLKKGEFKVFVDEEGWMFEAGEKEMYLKATEFCLKKIKSKDHPIGEIYQKLLNRFDSKKEKVLFEKSLSLSEKYQSSILISSKAEGLSYLKAKSFVVLNEGQLTGPSSLEKVVIQGGFWEGNLKERCLFSKDFIKGF